MPYAQYEEIATAGKKEGRMMSSRRTISPWSNLGSLRKNASFVLIFSLIAVRLVMAEVVAGEIANQSLGSDSTPVPDGYNGLPWLSSSDEARDKYPDIVDLQEGTESHPNGNRCDTIGMLSMAKSNLVG
jgi:hypothetical protein